MKSVQDNKDIKLSDKQKEVIRLMREGRERIDYFYSGNKIYVSAYNDSDFNVHSLPVNANTFTALKKLGIIYNDFKIHKSASAFYLTELGKTIQL